jgi:hypothetical protein
MFAGTYSVFGSKPPGVGAQDVTATLRLEISTVNEIAASALRSVQTW